MKKLKRLLSIILVLTLTMTIFGFKEVSAYSKSTTLGYDDLIHYTHDDVVVGSDLEVAVTLTSGGSGVTEILEVQYNSTETKDFRSDPISVGESGIFTLDTSLYSIGSYSFVIDGITFMYQGTQMTTNIGDIITFDVAEVDTSVSQLHDDSRMTIEYGLASSFDVDLSSMFMLGTVPEEVESMNDSTIPNSITVYQDNTDVSNFYVLVTNLDGFDSTDEIDFAFGSYNSNLDVDDLSYKYGTYGQMQSEFGGQDVMFKVRLKDGLDFQLGGYDETDTDGDGYEFFPNVFYYWFKAPHYFDARANRLYQGYFEFNNVSALNTGPIQIFPNTDYTFSFDSNMLSDNPSVTYSFTPEFAEYSLSGPDYEFDSSTGIYSYTFNSGDNYFLYHFNVNSVGLSDDLATNNFNVIFDLSKDEVPPVFTLSSVETTVEYGDAIDLLDGVTALDNIDGDLTADITYRGSLDSLGTHIISYDVIDSAGNQATTTRTYEVVDTYSPVINIVNDTVSIEYGESYDLMTGISASDNVDGDITNDVTVTGSVDTSTLGTYTIDYDVTDASGNVATTVTRTVNVVDTTPPTLNLQGDATLTLEYGSTFVDNGVLASDNVDGNLTSNVTVTGSVDTSTLGTYTIDYDVTDASGNAATTVTRTINVVDTTAPVITIDDLTTNNDHATALLTLLSAMTVIDNVDGDLSADISFITDEYTGNETVVGTYDVRISVDDASGNSASRLITITVNDATAPVINGPATFVKNPDYVFTEATLLSYYSATDDLDGDLTSSIEVVTNGLVDHADEVGTYDIELSVTDEAGNETSLSLTVTVNDSITPLLIIDGTELLVSKDQSFAVADFVNNLKLIGELPDKTYTTTVNLDTYTEHKDEPGTYDFDFDLSSTDGNSYTRSLDVHVIDYDVDFIAPEPGMLSQIGSLIGSYWWAGLIALVIIVGIFKKN